MMENVIEQYHTTYKTEQQQTCIFALINCILIVPYLYCNRQQHRRPAMCPQVVSGIRPSHS